MRTYSGRSIGFWGVIFSCLKAYKARIATQDGTVNHELDEVEGTYGRAYISVITYAAASVSDACTIGIFLLRSHFTPYHGLENFFSSVLRDIFIYNYVETFRLFHALVLGYL